MTGNAPLVTIGVPVRNGEDFLAEALDSALAQEYPNLEILISDNASVDATPDICRRYAEADPRVRWWRNAENAGFSWVDVSKAVAAGLTFRPLDETVRDTLAWAGTRPPVHAWRAGLSDEREKELLKLLLDRQQEDSPFQGVSP